MLSRAIEGTLCSRAGSLETWRRFKVAPQVPGARVVALVDDVVVVSFPPPREYFRYALSRPVLYSLAVLRASGLPLTWRGSKVLPYRSCGRLRVTLVRSGGLEHAVINPNGQVSPPSRGESVAEAEPSRMGES